MKILIITDAWEPQINGVVRTLKATVRCLEETGHEVKVAGPDPQRRWHLPIPGYRDISLEFFARPRLKKIIEAFNPDAIHVATEGTLGWAARNLCLKLKKPFTTCYHTRFPEYLAARSPFKLGKLVEALTYDILRRFHAPSSAVMVPTRSIARTLNERRFKNVALWTRGVDTALFQPYGKALETYKNLPRPILLYVGRVSVEKNLPGFLQIRTSGSKVVIGDGPDLKKLKARHPDVFFLGKLENEVLARHYAAADLFVFPSKTDTFGLVLLEACACGLRIASYPASGPADIFTDRAVREFAVMGQDLQAAVDRALRLPDNPSPPRRFAERLSWKACSEQFCQNILASTHKNKV